MPLQPVIIDCDPGHDDAIAILFAARHLDIRAITTVFGNATVEHTTRNALRICDLGGIAAPVAAGCGHALRGSYSASPVHGETGLDGALDLPAPQRAALDTHAALLIIEAAKTAPGEICLIATGPLSNVALALALEPRLAGWLRCISLMGGSTGAGNETPCAEANIFRDPEAADMVFRCGTPIRMAGLNLTRQAQIGRDVIDRLQNGGAAARAAASMLRFYLGQYERRHGMFAAPMHDPCAVLALVRPDLIHFERIFVQVELSSVVLRGMTVCDIRALTPASMERETKAHIDVGVTLDGAAALEAVFSTILDYP
jgi:purine nucleosidase